ncbi:MAG: peptidyl-prolyl cis-trans isomerase [Candidatus Sumerlaeia bacterium]|nr:peptidyl-prolyl cis-trans isomerase [Candidatus Sumerlaeia bacterium]
MFRVLVLVAITWLAVGCRLFRPCPECPVVVIAAPDAAEEPAPGPVATPRPRPQPTEPRALAWPRLFVGAGELGNDALAVQTRSLAASQREMDAARRQAPVDEDAESLAARVREDLLILEYLRDGALLRDPDFEASARQRLRSELARLVLERAVAAEAVVSDQEVRARYNERPDLYMLPARVSVRLILVATEADADTVRRRLAAGEDFGTVAGELSQHTSRRNGGVLEPFARGTFSSELEDLAFSLRSGEVGTAVSPRGTFIVEKIADSRESVIPFETVADSIRAELEAEKRAAAQAIFLERIREHLDGGGAAPEAQD